MSGKQKFLAFVGLVFLAAFIFDPWFRFRLLGTVQSLVMIAVGLTVIVYLWRRM